MLLLLPLFYFFGPAFSREVFRSGTSSFISGSSSSSSSSSSFYFFYGTRVFKTQVPCDKNISMSAIKTWVFVAQFLCWTRASKARDVILLNSFQFLLTNNIVWQTHAILQITPPPPLSLSLMLEIMNWRKSSNFYIFSAFSLTSFFNFFTIQPRYRWIWESLIHACLLAMALRETLCDASAN